MKCWRGKFVLQSGDGKADMISGLVLIANQLSMPLPSSMKRARFLACRLDHYDLHDPHYKLQLSRRNNVAG